MPSIIYTAPRQLDPTTVRGWARRQAPSRTLFYHGRLHRLEEGNYIYLCHRNHILWRALWRGTERRQLRITGDGEDKGPGWVLIHGEAEFPNLEVQCPSSRVRYLTQEEVRYLEQGELRWFAE